MRSIFGVKYQGVGLGATCNKPDKTFIWFSCKVDVYYTDMEHDQIRLTVSEIRNNSVL